MTKHIDVTITLLSALLAVSSVDAQDCADWSTTIPRPLHYQNPCGSTVLALGDLIIVAAWDSLCVCDGTREDLPILGRCGLTGSSVMRLRAVSGSAFLANEQHGVLWVDVTDPRQPVCTPVFTPGTSVRDLAKFDGGIVVVTLQGDIYVVDGLGPGMGNLLGHIDVDYPIGRVTAAGQLACIAAGSGFALVDLSDPGAPVVGPIAACPPSGQFMQPRPRDIVFAGDNVYGSIDYYHVNLQITESYVQKFEIGDQLNLVPVICAEQHDLFYGLAAIPGYIAAQSDWTVAFYDQENLDDSAVVAITTDGNLAGMSATDDDVYVVHRSSGLWRVRRSPFGTVRPLASQAVGYDPAGCGRFGLVAYSHRDFFGYGEHSVFVYDQVNPLDPVLVHSDESGLDPNVSISTEIVTQNEQWAILRSESTYIDGGYTICSLSAISTEGGVFPLVSPYDCRAHLAGDTLWVIHEPIGGPAILVAFDLSGIAPQCIGSQPVVRQGVPFLVNGVLLLIGDRISAYDAECSFPLPFLTEYDPGLSLNPYSVPPIADGSRLFVATSSGFAEFAIDGDSETPIVAHGVLGLGATPTIVTKHGELLAVGLWADGWRIASVANPEQPQLLATVTGGTVDGFVWSDDHLYVGIDNTVYLYDVSDPICPTWIGQASGTSVSNGRICTRAQYLLDGHRVLPLDCGDIVAVDGSSDDEAVEPPSVGMIALHPTTPNPFNPATAISFDLPRPAHATVTIHDLGGRRLATLLDAARPAGSHTLTWRGTDDAGRALPSGAYFVRLATESAVRTTKAVLLR